MIVIIVFVSIANGSRTSISFRRICWKTKFDLSHATAHRNKWNPTTTANKNLPRFAMRKQFKTPIRLESSSVEEIDRKPSLDHLMTWLLADAPDKNNRL